MTRSIQKFIPIFLILSFSFFVAMVVLFLTNTKAYTLDNDGFQVVGGIAMEYDTGTEFIYDETGATFDGADDYEYLDSSPLYVLDGDLMVIPEYSIYVNPRAIAYYQIPCFSELEYASSTIINEVGVTGGFIFDGQNTYTFLDDMTVRINGEDVEMGKYSTISLYSNNVYSYYNFTDGTIVVDTIITNVLKASCSDYSVDLLNDILYTSSNEEILLFDDPELLDVIE